MSATVTLRTGTREDWPHVVNSFIAEYRKSPDGKPIQYVMLDKCIKALLASPAWILTVMAPTDGGSEIYGWILWQNKAVAWVHVKEFWRGRGFSRVLMGAANHSSGEVRTPFLVSRTDYAKDFPSFLRSKGWIVRYRPWLLLKEIL